MAPVKLNPEWKAMWDIFAMMPKPVINDVFDIRKASNAALAASVAVLPDREDIEETKHTVVSLDGTNIDVHQFAPLAASSDPKPQRAIVYAFGGGMVAGSVDIWRKMIRDLSHRSETQIFAVNYRLAPEHPAPAAVEDLYSAARWLQLRAGEFAVDPGRLVLCGHSAGGGIAAGAALMARDKGLPNPLAAMLLVYPMLDDRTVLPADDPMQQYFVWPSRSNDIAWTALMGGKERGERTDDNVSVYGAPARAKDLSGLPDTYIDVGGLDLFRDEDMEFARRLSFAGVHVEFHLYPGVAHGFDNLADMKIAQRVRSEQVRFLTSY